MPADPGAGAGVLGGRHIVVSVVVHGSIVLRALMAGGLVLIAAWMAWETRG